MNGASIAFRDGDNGRLAGLALLGCARERRPASRTFQKQIRALRLIGSFCQAVPSSCAVLSMTNCSARHKLEDASWSFRLVALSSGPGGCCYQRRGHSAPSAVTLPPRTSSPDRRAPTHPCSTRQNDPVSPDVRTHSRGRCCLTARFREALVQHPSRRSRDLAAFVGAVMTTGLLRIR